VNNRRQDAIDEKELKKALARQKDVAGSRGEPVNQIDDTTPKAKSKDAQPGEGDDDDYDNETSELRTDSELENGSQAKAARSEATIESKASGQPETE